MDVAQLTIDELAQRCAEETQAYRRQSSTDTRYCFELLRRALVAELPEALRHVMQIYEGQVRRWVFQHSGFATVDEESDYFVSVAFSNFFFAIRGEKFHRFPRLAQVLAYLKICVHTAITQYQRDHQKPPATDIDHVPVGYDVDFDTHIQFDEIWAAICEVLPDPADQSLTHLKYVQDMKPAEIAERYPEHYENARAVTVALQRIRRNLRANPRLRSVVGVE